MKINHQETSLKTAVLFLVFNRPEATSKVFDAIRKARPTRLYIAADGPRNDYGEDNELVIKVREIATRVDWSCEVKTLFRDKNLGCKYAVSSGIDWFFKYENEGIILEDDVVPVNGFFEYCELSLEKYRNNPRVGMVTGHSIEDQNTPSAINYMNKFSSYGSVWGWATWSRVWSQYDVEILSWSSSELDFLRRKQCANSLYVDMWSKIFDGIQFGKINSWAYQLNYLLLRHDMLCAVPPYNLIENIGYGEDATHTFGQRPTWATNAGEIKPQNIIFTEPIVDRLLDQEIGVKNFGITKYARFKHLIKKIIG
jgi:hypothetical protein